MRSQTSPPCASCARKMRALQTTNDDVDDVDADVNKYHDDNDTVEFVFVNADDASA